MRKRRCAETSDHRGCSDDAVQRWRRSNNRPRWDQSEIGPPQASWNGKFLLRIVLSPVTLGGKRSWPGTSSVADLLERVHRGRHVYRDLAPLEAEVGWGARS